MTVRQIFFTALFFSVVPISHSLGQEPPLKEDVKYDDVQANPNDYQDTKAKKRKAPQKTMVANCNQFVCSRE